MITEGKSGKTKIGGTGLQHGGYGSIAIGGTALLHGGQVNPGSMSVTIEESSLIIPGSVVIVSLPKFTSQVPPDTSCLCISLISYIISSLNYYVFS
jgi:hypothetical protein